MHTDHKILHYYVLTFTSTSNFNSLIPIFQTLYARSTNTFKYEKQTKKNILLNHKLQTDHEHKYWGIMKTVKPGSEINECTITNISVLIYDTHRSSNITLWPLASCNTWNTWSTRYALCGEEKENMMTSMRPAERKSYDAGEVLKAVFPHLEFRGHLELHY